VCVQATSSIQATALIQFGHDIGEHRVKQGRFDRLEFGTDLAVAGDLAHAKQCLTVRPALGGLQISLVRQE
jgi:hypothetical protein